MKAKDTVMKATKEHPWSKACLRAAEAQAKISFKAGIEEAQNRLHSPEVLAIADEALKEAKQAGRREVVDSIREYGLGYVLDTKLKDWGIEGG